MTLNFDLLGLACAEYTEHDGVKGVFIPEEPNFTYTPGSGYRKGATPPRAVVNVQLYKTLKRQQKYDWMGRQMIPARFRDAYMANPNTVSRKRWCVYGYNFLPGSNEGEETVSTAADFERLLED